MYIFVRNYARFATKSRARVAVSYTHVLLLWTINIVRRAQVRRNNTIQIYIYGHCVDGYYERSFMRANTRVLLYVRYYCTIVYPILYYNNIICMHAISCRIYIACTRTGFTRRVCGTERNSPRALRRVVYVHGNARA